MFHRDVAHRQSDSRPRAQERQRIAKRKVLSVRHRMTRSPPMIAAYHSKLQKLNGVGARNWQSTKDDRQQVTDCPWEPAFHIQTSSTCHDALPWITVPADQPNTPKDASHLAAGPQTHPPLPATPWLTMQTHAKTRLTESHCQAAPITNTWQTQLNKLNNNKTQIRKMRLRYKGPGHKSLTHTKTTKAKQQNID
jgi:hypothetical protein